ncbi:MAG: hypothetical protein HYS12_26590, partial [Planctomycetes bacterium]|nr:hypothetical protein [Planctomycetota bacterium]
DDAIGPDSLARRLDGVDHATDVGRVAGVVVDAVWRDLVRLVRWVDADLVARRPAEEPAVPGNVEVFKRLKEQIPIPLAAGERDRTIWEFAPYLHERCLDIVQPDVAHTGGVTSMKKIAILAEAYQVPLAPHCTTSPLGASASLHVAASIPLLLIHETAMNAIEWGEQFLRRTWKVDKEGYASLPEGPGLGVAVDEKAMARVAAEPKVKFVWPIMRLRDGSVADY